MKKKAQSPKLRLAKETLRSLEPAALVEVQGQRPPVSRTDCGTCTGTLGGQTCV